MFKDLFLYNDRFSGQTSIRFYNCKLLKGIVPYKVGTMFECITVYWESGILEFQVSKDHISRYECNVLIKEPLSLYGD